MAEAQLIDLKRRHDPDKTMQDYMAASEQTARLQASSTSKYILLSDGDSSSSIFEEDFSDLGDSSDFEDFDLSGLHL